MTQSEYSSQPPRAPRRPHVVESHGERREDPYFWLREREDPAVTAHLEAENAYTKAMLAPLAPLRDWLYREFLGRIKETDLSVPVRIDHYLYYTRTETGAQYPIFCRRHALTAGAAEEIMLDVNALAAGYDYFEIGVVEVSPDHRYLAYSQDMDGSETYTVYVKDLDTGEFLDDGIPGTGGDAAWAADSRTLFYTRLDEVMRPYRVYRHRLGDSVGDDALVLHEPDDAFFIHLDKTKDERYLIIALESNVTSEVYLLDASRPDATPRLCQTREQGVEYSVEHREGLFYVLTNRDAVNFRLLATADFARPIECWQTLVAHDDAVTLEGMEIFAGHLVLYVREAGLEKIRVLRFPDLTAHSLEFDEPAYSAYGGANPQYRSHKLRFGYASLATPQRVYEYDMDTRGRRLLKQAEVPSGHDPADYVTERIHARAPDGTRVPLSLIYRRDCAGDRPAPCLLYGYGAYGINVDPDFSPTRLSLLDRGFVCAIAHVRGGGELGENWKNSGKQQCKDNTFSDFIAAAEHLIELGYTQPERLAIMGGSAGGLLIGAVLNRRPDLFAAAVAQVPFVDVLNTMEDASLPLTVIEYDEWGDPADPLAYRVIRNYAPYENVRAHDYPALLVMAGLNDPRVQYWEPAKWVARLRDANTGTRPILLKMHMGAGHAGASGRYAALREIAFEYAFLINRLSL